MMVRRVFHSLQLLSVLFLGLGCNQKDLGYDAGVIRFAADYDIPDSARIGGVTDTYNIPDFRVSAFRNDQWGAVTLMDNVVVTRTGINSWIYSPPVEWPEDESVDFFAVSPASIEIANNQWWMHTFRFENVDCSTDLLVAVRCGVFQTSGSIRLNFRHALARVSVCLKNSDPSCYIGVTEVEICNFPKFGTFFFPDVTTSPDTNSGELFSAWEYFNAQESLTLFSTSSGNVLDIGVQPESIGPENIFMIPFAMTQLEGDKIWEGTHIRVRYLVNGIEKEARIPLYASTPGSKWLPGFSYRYTIDLNPAASSTRSLPPLSLSLDSL